MAANFFTARLHAGYERGLALIAVLWMLTLLTLLATAMLAVARSNARLSSRNAQFISSAATADSAIRLAMLRTFAPQSADAHFGFSTQWRLELFNQQVDVRVEREAGRADLNATNAPLLAAVFVAGGVDPHEAQSFAARIIDWRDADDEPGAGGAERQDYALDQPGYAPRNGPFESVEELRQVLGLAELSPEILDAFTVYSTRSPTIAYEFAHPLVRRALDLLSTSAAETPQHIGTSDLNGQAIRIHACTGQNKVTLCRAAIIRWMSQRNRPFRTHAWYTEQ
jgi:general secretion pathway protein K